MCFARSCQENAGKWLKSKSCSSSGVPSLGKSKGLCSISPSRPVRFAVSKNAEQKSRMTNSLTLQHPPHKCITICRGRYVQSHTTLCCAHFPRETTVAFIVLYRPKSIFQLHPELTGGIIATSSPSLISRFRSGASVSSMSI
jgi:hypothetical protein